MPGKCSAQELLCLRMMPSEPSLSFPVSHSHDSVMEFHTCGKMVSTRVLFVYPVIVMRTDTLSTTS